jgi:hypothetical protein
MAVMLGAGHIHTTRADCDVIERGGPLADGGSEGRDVLARGGGSSEQLEHPGMQSCWRAEFLAQCGEGGERVLCRPAQDRRSVLLKQHGQRAAKQGDVDNTSNRRVVRGVVETAQDIREAAIDGKRWEDSACERTRSSYEPVIEASRI